VSQAFRTFLGQAGTAAFLLSVFLVGNRLRQERWFRSVHPMGFLLMVAASWLVTWTNRGTPRYIYLLVALASTGAFATRFWMWIQDKRMLSTDYSLTQVGDEDALILTLHRRAEDEANTVECIVTDPMGGRSRQVFSEAGASTQASYPQDFSGYTTYFRSKKPWGDYKVAWQTYKLKGTKLRRGRRARDSFNFQPFGHG
jgi:hypothetical protein